MFSNTIRHARLILARTYLWVVVWFPERLSCLNPKSYNLWFSCKISESFLLVLTWIRWIFSRHLVIINWITNKRSSWFWYYFFIWNIIVARPWWLHDCLWSHFTNSKGPCTVTKLFFLIVLSRVWSFFLLFPPVAHRFRMSRWTWTYHFDIWCFTTD